MSSQSPMREREESRHVSVQTLLIASAASFVAAVVTSQFSIVGTPIAAALTPVIVALVSELLHRPTEVVVQRVTTDRPAVLPDAAGAGPRPPADADPLPDLAPEEPATQSEQPVTVYRPRRSNRRRIAVGVVALTAVLAFAIAAVALTVPELITGQSLGSGDRKTSIFGGHHEKKNQQSPTTPEAAPPQQSTSTTTPPQNTTTTPAETEPAPSATTTQPQPNP